MGSNITRVRGAMFGLARWLFLCQMLLITSWATAQEEDTTCTFNDCAKVYEHGGGWTTGIQSVEVENDSCFRITLKVCHDGCPGPICPELSHYSVEAIPGTYDSVMVMGVNGNTDLGPNLGNDPFDGFKRDNISGIGDGEAGHFTIKYILCGGLQDQRVLAKAGNNDFDTLFTIADFEYVLNGCPGEEPPCVDADAGEGGRLMLCDADSNNAVNLMAVLMGTPDTGGIWMETSMMASGVILNDPTMVDFSGVEPGMYSFKYKVEAMAPCASDSSEIMLAIIAGPDAGDDGMLMLCEADSNDMVNLMGALGGTPDMGGDWTETSAMSSGVSLVDPTDVSFLNVGPGTYLFEYVVMGQMPCDPDTALVTVVVKPMANAGMDGQVDLCIEEVNDSVDLVSALMGMPDTGGVWMEMTSSGVDLSDPSLVDFSEVPVGNYSFKYVVNSMAPCDPDTALVVVNMEDCEVDSCDIGDCGVQKMHAENGFSTAVTSVIQNCDGTFDIKLKVCYDGCPGPDCKELSNYAIELNDTNQVGFGDDDWTFSGVVGTQDSGPNLGGNPFEGFKIDDISGFGNNGDAGYFIVCYTIKELQDTYFNAKAGNLDDTVKISLQEFQTVLECTPQPELFSAGIDTTLNFCDILPLGVLNLFELLGGEPDTGGTWHETSPVPHGAMLGDGTAVDFSGIIPGSYSFRYRILSEEEGCSDSAQVFLIIEDAPYAGVDSTLTYCKTEDLSGVNLMGALGEEADTGGVWMETTIPASGVGLDSPMMVDFSGEEPGTYTFKYVVGDSASICGTDTAMITVVIEGSPYAGVDSTLTYCEVEDLSGVNLIGALGGEADTGGVWMETTMPASGVGLENPMMVDFSGEEPGTYTFKYVVGDSASICGTDTAMITVVIEGSPYAGVDSTLTYCETEDLSGVNLMGALGGEADTGGVWMETTMPVSGVGLEDLMMVDFSGEEPGTYTFKYVVGDSASICGTDTALVTVVIEEAPFAGEDGMLTLCASDSNDAVNLMGALGGSPDMGGTWMETGMPMSGVSLSDPTMVDFSTADPGMYLFKYVVLSQGDCPNDTAQVIVKLIDLQLEKIMENASCGQDDGSIDLNIIGGTMPFVIEWTGPEGFMSDLAEIDGLAPGEYIVKVTDANGCMATDTCTIDEEGGIKAKVWKKPAHCGWFDGKICFKKVRGCGIRWFEYSIDGGETWSKRSCYGWLDGGIYHLMVRDKHNPDVVLDMGEMELPSISDLSASVKVRDADCYSAGKIIIKDRQGGSGWYMYSYDGGETWEWNSSKYWAEPGTYHVLMRDGQSEVCVLDLGEYEVGDDCGQNGDDCQLSATVRGVNAGCDWGAIIFSKQKGGAGWYMYSIDGGDSWNYNAYQGWLWPGTYHLMMCDGANPECHIDLGELVIEDEGCRNPYAWRTANTPNTASTEESNVYPNPVSENGFLTVAMPEGNEQAQYRLVDATGQVLKEGNSSRNTFTFSIEGIKPGQYFLELVDDQGNVIVKKLMIE